MQYLIIPVRVEVNVTARDETRQPHVVRHMLVYGVLWLGACCLMSNQISGTAMVFVADGLGEHPGEVVPIMLFASLNIHHYLTDGVKWNPRNPAVRRDLFTHLPVPEEKPGRKAARKR